MGRNIVLAVHFCVSILLCSYQGIAQNPATPDTSFVKDASLVPSAGANGSVRDIKIQLNGNVVVVGDFTVYNGTFANRVVRLNEDGSIDNTFNVGLGADNLIRSVAIQPNGKILLAGDFTFFAGLSKNKVVRLNVDGSVDHSFNIGSGFDYSVSKVALQNSGKILLAGGFYTYNGTAVKSMLRLNEDGSIDNTFNIGNGTNGNIIHTFEFQDDGKILVGGDFQDFNNSNRRGIVRLNEDGSVDNTFYFPLIADPFAGVKPFGVKAIAIDNEQIYLAPSQNADRSAYPGLLRCSNTGGLDGMFNVNSTIGNNSYIEAVVILNTGEVLAGGSINFNSVRNIVCLTANGNLSSFFNFKSLVNGPIYTMSMAKDNKIIVGGHFTQMSGVIQNRITRIKGAAFNRIHGKVYTDANADCVNQKVEGPMSSIIIKALPGPFYSSSNKIGDYTLTVDANVSSYTITQALNESQKIGFVEQCATSHSLTILGVSKDTLSFDFADSVKLCALLHVSIQPSRWRRCFRGYSVVEYGNKGGLDATGALLKVEYPDYVIPISTYPMWTSKTGNVLLYDLGIIDKQSVGAIILTDSVICDNESIRGLTQCIRATISPASNCIVENPAWDKSSMEVGGRCDAGRVVFTISTQVQVIC